MDVKKWITLSTVLIVSIVIMAVISFNNVSAQSAAGSQTMKKMRALEVELNDDYFNPNIITLPHGQSSTLVLRNKGQQEHTFTVNKLSIDVEVQPGKTKTITVQPKNQGTYELICRYHSGEGMVGKVIVE